MRVTIVIPTYNERENLPILIERIAGVISSMRSQHDTPSHSPSARGGEIGGEVLIVDDNSPDNTGALAEELARKYTFVHVLHRPSKEGLGAALLVGFERALADGADVIVQMDADGSHEPEEIPRMIREIERGADLVLGSRRVPGGRIIGWGWHRRIASWTAQTLSRHLLGLRTRDVTSGFRAWRAQALLRVLGEHSNDSNRIRMIQMSSTHSRHSNPHSQHSNVPLASGYAFQVEMVHRAERLGLRIAEHPITFRDRERGRSKLGWRDVLGFFRTCKRLWIGTHDRRFALWLGISLIILTSLPYLYGWLRTPPGHVYTGVHALASGDMAVYGSYIEQVRDGRWLFVDLFTSEWPQRPFLNIFWLPVGFLARLTHASTAITFHLVRLILIVPFIIFLARFVAAFLRKPIAGWPVRTIRRTALLLLAFSSGLGPIIAEGLEPASNARWRPGYDHWPIDLWVPESNTFLTLLQSPHLIASLWLILLIVLATLRFVETKRWRWSVGGGIGALALFQFHPFYVPTVTGVLIVWIMVESVASRRIRWDAVLHAVVVSTISAPFVAYHLWLVYADPITTMRAAQNLLFTPEWWLVAIGYGSLVPITVIGVSRLVRERTIEGRLLLTWLMVTVVLIYSPLTWQRRLTEGLHVVIVLISMVGLFPLLSWLRARVPTWFRRYAWSLTTATIVAIPLLGISTTVNLVRDFILYTIRFPRSIPRHAFYYPAPAVEAMQWVRSHTSLGEATFAAGLDGNFLPMYAARQSVLGHGVETANFVEKYRQTYALTSGQLSLAEARAFLDRERTRFILVTDVSRGLWAIDPASLPGATLVYRNGGAEIYELAN